MDGQGLPRPGEVIAGKYQIVRELGSGGMGVVLEAVHLRLGQRLAIKTLLPQASHAEGFLARFEREARAAARLRGPHIARVVDVDTLPGGLTYMVMEYLDGHNLAQEVAARGALPLDEAVRWILQACEGIAEAHAAGIVHRDLKPANLFLAEESGRRILKVLDFGISKDTYDQTSITGTQVMLGSPAYMSPEQIRSSKHVDERTDVWSLGVIAYELLTGQQPFVGETASAALAAIVADDPLPLRARRPELPAALERVIQRALSKQPAQRFSSVSELADAIRHASGFTGNERATPRRPVEDARSPLPAPARSEALQSTTATGMSFRSSVQSLPRTWRLGLLAAAGVLSSAIAILTILVFVRRVADRGASDAPSVVVLEPATSTRVVALPSAPASPQTAASAPVVAPVASSGASAHSSTPDAGAPKKATIPRPSNNVQHAQPPSQSRPAQPAPPAPARKDNPPRL